MRIILCDDFVHYSAAKTFLEHGINVVCEKPMTSQTILSCPRNY